jgi:ankyrin repeat protein
MKLDKFNIHGQTSLSLAAIAKDFQAMQLLIKNGADVNTRDTRNLTPLHHCIRSQRVYDESTKASSHCWHFFIFKTLFHVMNHNCYLI